MFALAWKPLGHWVLKQALLGRLELGLRYDGPHRSDSSHLLPLCHELSQHCLWVAVRSTSPNHD